MESILGLDLTKTPAQAVLIKVDNGAFSVAAQRAIDVGDAFSKTALLGPDEQAVEGGEADSEAEAAKQSTAKSIELPESAVQSLRDLPLKWDRAAVLAPAHDILSLNISLPFADPKNISRVLDLELQDRVPFEIDSFLLNHSVVGPDSEGGNDVFVSGADRAWIANTIRACRKMEVEPAVITTAGSLVAALDLVARERMGGSGIFIIRAGQNIHLILTSHGKLCSERIIEAPQVEGDWKSETAAELRIALSALEKRYPIDPGPICLLTSAEESRAISEAVGRECSNLEMAAEFSALPEESKLAFLTALLAKEESPPVPLTNFRTGEFSYNPKVRELLRALKAIAPQILLALLAGAMLLLGSYAYRSLEISNLKKAMHEQIARVVPGIEALGLSDIEAVSQARSSMELELKALGSPARIRPLDALFEISKDLGGKAQTSLTGLLIRDGKVYLDITVEDYSAVDQLVRTLNRNGNYCKVEKHAGASPTFGKERSFKVEITLCP